MNLDGIYMDMDELIEKYDGKIASVSDSKEIQQISLFCQQNRNDYRKAVLTDMINPMFAYAGLYPHVMVLYDEGVAADITKEGRKLLDELLKKRKQFKDESNKI